MFNKKYLMPETLKHSRKSASVLWVKHEGNLNLKTLQDLNKTSPVPGNLSLQP